MKRLLLFLLFIASLGNAQVVFESSLSEAFKKAKEQNKPVFIEYYNSECSVCKRLGDLLKNDSLVYTYYNNKFINYAMNTNDSLSVENKLFIANANLHFESVPVLLYFDKNKNFLHHTGVNTDAASIVNEGKKATLSDYNSSGLKAKYDAGDRSVRTLYAYADFLIVTKNEKLLNKVTQELFNSFKEEELLTKKSYIVLKQVVHTTENGFFQFWMKHLDDLKGFESGYKEGTEKEVLTQIVLKELSDPLIKKWDDKKKETFKKYILDLKITDNPNVYFE
jgi:thiol-disulfide isomerase/thioredoxin